MSSTTFRSWLDSRSRIQPPVCRPPEAERELADRRGPRDGATQRPLAPERMRPLARTPFYAARGVRARILARVPVRTAADVRPPIFIIGCGRSGTTLLGELFAAHPAVRYIV